ncbi:TetR family transcriptional regulator [Oleiphilus messinensis]|uniref:TetR family transcriptional regulator n=1 Tax=Oleiphilus messinensis TaxID=141451 RepID=A0A1Y0I7L1_9GAMM|nr:TetR/AcrR family transcriptional regulator [Oleiphilus messinensis]ARU56488.1 TetR family transcriptional regulator [Oleiphilus messinensis]
MRYSADHKAALRKKLVAAAGALCKENGFGVTGVDALMATVGLSGGAFYGHFKTKSDLLNDIVANELATTRARFEAMQGGDGASAEALLRAYFSRLHVDNPGMGCALPSLSNEVARANDEVKETYEKGLQALHDLLAENLPNPERAWALLAMAAGTISMARAVKSPEMQERILSSAVDLMLSELSTD